MAIPEIKRIRFNLWLTIPLYTHKNFCYSDNDFLKILIITCLQIHTISKYPVLQNCKEIAILPVLNTSMRLEYFPVYTVTIFLQTNFEVKQHTFNQCKIKSSETTFTKYVYIYLYFNYHVFLTPINTPNHGFIVRLSVSLLDCLLSLKLGGFLAFSGWLFIFT